jgi:ubiquinone/menaquinone biosynthesis C-methylase UbiE
MLVSTAPPDRSLFVPETRFGHWFLGTETWFQSVLKVAILDLLRLMEGKKRSYPVVVDVGCGQGRSFRLLKIMLRSTRLIGVEMEQENVEIAEQRVKRDRVPVEFLRSDCAAIDLPDETADVVFCHQTFHHLVQQERSLREFRRILKPGGLLLFSESTKAYIHSWVIRLLFAHPMHVQRTADEYMAMIRESGFVFEPRNVSFPHLWWCRWDFGLLERLGVAPKATGQRVERLVNLVAQKPLA